MRGREGEVEGASEREKEKEREREREPCNIDPLTSYPNNLATVTFLTKLCRKPTTYRFRGYM